MGGMGEREIDKNALGKRRRVDNMFILHDICTYDRKPAAAMPAVMAGQSPTVGSTQTNTDQ